MSEIETEKQEATPTEGEKIRRYNYRKEVQFAYKEGDRVTVPGLFGKRKAGTITDHRIEDMTGDFDQRCFCPSYFVKFDSGLSSGKWIREEVLLPL